MRRGILKMKGLWVHPKTRIPYLRKCLNGKTIYIPLPRDLPHDHPDFIDAWAKAHRGLEAPKVPTAGTLASSWNAVVNSPRFGEVSKAYQEMLLRQSSAIVAKAGHVKTRAIEHHHVRQDISAARNPAARKKAWRFWADYCLDRGWLNKDPTVGIRTPKTKSSGHPTWSRADIAKFREAYPIGSSPRAIMELAYWTGARRGDVVRLGPQHVHEGVLSFGQGKTGDMSYVPWTCPLPEYAAHMEPDRQVCFRAIAHMGGGLTFIQTIHGKSRSEKAAGQDISNACRKIGLALSIHGLRKARAVALAEAGGTTHQIGAWTGHRSLTEIAHYTREVDRRRAVTG
ncbi:tyrosine-type recombinase/integrase [Rhodobacterales bacterium HKCCE3408]|nr:tyrosine-type recombinase/integrase [Rhodobacterales bacterium HKCCE3408]